MRMLLLLVLLPLSLSLAACGGGVKASTVAGGCDEGSGCPRAIDAGHPGADAGHPGVDAGHDAASPEAGACPANSSAVYGCGGTFFYCCPDDGGNCEAPSCESLDAGHEAAAEDAGGCSSDASCPKSPPSDGGTCQAGEYLLIPCCGGVNDSACSNSNGPPAPLPFCTALPASCAGQATCTVGQCEGSIDQTKRTLGCNCI